MTLAPQTLTALDLSQNVNVEQEVLCPCCHGMDSERITYMPGALSDPENAEDYEIRDACPLCDGEGGVPESWAEAYCEERDSVDFDDVIPF